MKKISLQDISVKLKISKSTISIVLNGKGDEKRVSQETQEKILKFAREHNYKANQLARGLSRGKSDTIGLVVPDISDSFYARIARRIERKAEQSGYNVVFSSTGERKDSESKLIQSMLDRQVDGLIIASSQKNHEDIISLQESNFPFVLIDRHYPDIESDYVIIDNYGGTVSAVNQLVKQGRQHIAFVSLSDGLEALNQRFLGYKTAMESHTLGIKEASVHFVGLKNLEEEMQHCVEELFTGAQTVDGIVFATHFLTAAGLRELKKRGIRIPEDVGIVSFGQMEAFDLLSPPITSVSLPANEMGDKAVEILLNKINGVSTDSHNECLETAMIVRRSCGAGSF